MQASTRTRKTSNSPNATKEEVSQKIRTAYFLKHVEEHQDDVEGRLEEDPQHVEEHQNDEERGLDKGPQEAEVDHDDDERGLDKDPHEVEVH